MLNFILTGGSGSRSGLDLNYHGASLNMSHSDLNSTSIASLDDSAKQNAEDSLNLPPVATIDDANKSSNTVDDSFSALLSRKKNANVKQSDNSKDLQVIVAFFQDQSSKTLIVNYM
jgi:tRNA A37 threonylcarbamoyltransferase TsaD